MSTSVETLFVPVRYYTAQDIYYYQVDNRPLQDIVTNLTTLAETSDTLSQTVTGVVDISLASGVSVSIPEASGQNAVIVFTGTLTSPCTAVFPSGGNQSWVINNQTNEDVYVSYVGSANSTLLESGYIARFYTDGTNMVGNVPAGLDQANTFSQPQVFAGTVDVSGGATFASTLDVSGGAIFASTLDVSGGATFAEPVTLPAATASGEAVNLGQAFEILQPTGSETITPTALTTVVQTGALTASATLTIEDGTVLGQEVIIYGSGSAYTTTVSMPVTAGSPSINYPYGAAGYSYTIPASSPTQGIRLWWDGTNYRAQTFGPTIVAPATANNEAVNLGQVANVAPLSAFASNASATSVAVTTGTLTAPSNGTAFVFAYGAQVATDDPGLALTASLSGLVTLYAAGFENSYSGAATLAMTAGQASTFTATASGAAAESINISIFVIFVPTP